MAVFLLTFAIMTLAGLGLAVGVLAGRKPLNGSCGGVGRALAEPDYVCSLCGGDEAKCEEERAKGTTTLAAADLAYDASSKHNANGEK